MRGVTIAVVGLGFGRAFVPIYSAHPDVDGVVLVEPDDARRTEVARQYGIGDGYHDLEAALSDYSIDAVHILAPVMAHADMVSAAPSAGKHVASAVPMATTLEDLDRLIAAQTAADRNYMTMETTVFARDYGDHLLASVRQAIRVARKPVLTPAPGCAADSARTMACHFPEGDRRARR